jgi:PilZ domain
MRRLRERQLVTLGFSAGREREDPVDAPFLVVLIEAENVLLQSVTSTPPVLPTTGEAAMLAFEHEGRLVMLRGVAIALTPTLFTFRVGDGIGIRPLRERARLCVSVPATVAVAGRPEIRGTTIDISAGGAALALPEHPADAEHEVTLELPDGSAPLTLPSVVVRHTPEGVAVRFRDPCPAAVRRLEGFIVVEKARAVWAA